mgnify:CR=1 FL=1
MAQNPKLVLLSEKLRGKSFELDREMLTVGRREQCDICIKDSTLSSHHCDFIRHGETYKVRDNDSTNGTRVNNVQLAPGEEVELKNFDVIQLGAVETLFENENAETQTMASRTEAGTATVNLDNASPFAVEERKIQERNKKLVMISLICVGLILLILAIVILSSVFSMGQ